MIFEFDRRRVVERLVNSPIVKPVDVGECRPLDVFNVAPRALAMNKAASVLRRLARPDLAVELTTHQLSLTRLNYYSLVVRSSAYIDLGKLDEAIADGELAQKHEPQDSLNYSAITLSRGYRERYKRDAVIEDGEKSLEFARQALEIVTN